MNLVKNSIILAAVSFSSVISVAKKGNVMMKFISLIVTSVLIFNSAPSFSWTPNGETVTIDKIYGWQDDSKVVFETSLGHKCYVPPEEKNMYSLVLSLYATRNKASIHCHDTGISIGGVTANRVHRVIALK